MAEATTGVAVGPPASSVDAAQAPPGPSLSSRAARGFAWAMGFMLFARAIGIVGQFVLAKLLLPEDFGTVAVAQSIATFVAVVQLAGLPEILVQRQKSFSVWSSAAFWMALALGAFSGLALAGLGPLAAWWNNNPALTWIMAMVGAQCLVSSMQVVPTATMQVGLRLRAITALNMMQSVGGIVLTVTLAALGLGAYSLALGPLAASVAVLAAMWWIAKPRVRRRPQVRRWKFLWGDSALLLATGLIGNVVSQGAIFLLGIAHPERTVGLFSWAWMLSLQTVVLVTGSLNVVLFPTLSKLQHDPPRMLAAFFRAARMIAMVGVPACLLQAACAPWFIDLVFVDRWDEAAPAAVLLSIGLAFGIVGSLPASLMKALGHFKRLFWITVGYGSLFVLLVAGAVWGHDAINRVLGTHMNPATVTAGAVMLAYVIAGPLGTYAVAYPLGARKRDVLLVYVPALMLAGIAVGWAYLAAWTLPSATTALGLNQALGPLWANRVDLMVKLAMTVTLTGLTYPLLAWVGMPDSARELVQRMSDTLGGKVPVLRKFAAWAERRA